MFTSYKILGILLHSSTQTRYNKIRVYFLFFFLVKVELDLSNMNEGGFFRALMCL